MTLRMYFQSQGSRLGIGHTVAAQGSVTRNVLLLNYFFGLSKRYTLFKLYLHDRLLLAPFRTFLWVRRVWAAAICTVGVAWSPLPNPAHTAGRWHELRPCPYLWHLKQRSGFGTNSSTEILIWPALTNCGGVGAEKVRINVLDGSVCHHYNAWCVWERWRLVRRDHSMPWHHRNRADRGIGASDNASACVRWGKTVISMSNQIVMASAFVARCLVLTSSSTVLLWSLLASSTSPTPHWMNFWTENIEYL